MIVVEKLSKQFADRVAVDGITFQSRKGEVLGFLGPNGAGKSTTMRMITGYLAPTSGRVEVDGFDMAKDPLQAKARIGYLPESPPLYHEMAVRDYLVFVGRLKGLAPDALEKRLAEVLRRCWLEDVQTRIIGQLSKGYKQRVGLAQALIHDPPVLILDEPTSGLDPKQIMETRALLKELAGEHTIILSTHILSEVQNLCDRVLIISKGQIVAEDSPERLETQLRRGGVVHMTVRAQASDLQARLAAHPSVQDVKVRPAGDFQELEVTTAPGTDLREDLARYVVGQGWGLLELRTAGMSLEDIFIQLTSQQADTREVSHV